MKKILALVMICLASSAVMAQKDVDIDGNTKFTDRLFFGGGLGFSAGSEQTNVSLSPIIGYMITQQWSAGVGITYQYLKLKRFDVSDNLWGGNLFTRYNIQQFFIQTEYDYINYDANLFDDVDERDSATRLLAGGGISQPLGNKGAVNLMALYDLTYDNAGPYDSPWVFRIYFSF